MSIGRVALAQIVYWAGGAIWPLIDIRSFERVTGPKRDDWLVRTVALLMLSVAGTLAFMRRRGDDEAMRALGASSSAAVGAVALAGPLVGRISKVYLLDAAAEFALLAGWLVAGRARRHASFATYRAPRVRAERTTALLASGGDSVERDDASAAQSTGPQGGGACGGQGGGKPQAGFSGTVDPFVPGSEGDETHDPEPLTPRRPDPPRPDGR